MIRPSGFGLMDPPLLYWAKRKIVEVGTYFSLRHAVVYKCSLGVPTLALHGPLSHPRVGQTLHHPQIKDTPSKESQAPTEHL